MSCCCNERGRGGQFAHVLHPGSLGSGSLHASRGAAGASDYVLYTFQLIDPNNSDIVWEGFHEIKKQGKDDVTYR